MGAAVRLLASVDFLMILERADLVEAHAAELTLVWSLSSVDPCVNAKDVVLLESLAAVFTAKFACLGILCRLWSPSFPPHRPSWLFNHLFRIIWSNKIHILFLSILLTINTIISLN